MWQGAKTGGYGVVRFQSKTVYAHRLAYENQFGVIPQGFLVSRLCKPKACVRPDHLILRTPSAVRYESHSTRAKDKMSFEIARAIRDDYAYGGITQFELARKFDISQPMVNAIIKGTRWNSENELDPVLASGMKSRNTD